MQKARAGLRVQNLESLGAKPKEKGPRSNYFTTAEGPTCKTKETQGLFSKKVAAARV